MVVAVVKAVNTSVPDPEVTEAESRLHVTGLVAPAGLLTEQVKATVPLKPPIGVTEIVDVLPVVAPAARSMLPLLPRRKVGELALEVARPSCQGFNL